MAISQNTLDAIADYAWTDIQKAAKAAMLNIALGGNVLRINGREITRISMDDAKTLYEFATAQVNNDNNPGDGGIILATLQ